MLFCINIIGTDDGRVSKKLCTSCQVISRPGEKCVGEKTLKDCKQGCREEADCTAIDVGKGNVGNKVKCCHNYGLYQRHYSDNNNEVYILT